MSTMFGLFKEQFSQTGLSERTVKNYESTWNKFERWMRDNQSELNDAGLATSEDITNFKRYIKFQGGREGRPAKPSTIAVMFVHLNAIFRFFVDEGLIQNNPLDSVERQPTLFREPKWLSLGEQKKLLQELSKQDNKRDNALVLLMLRAGLRVHEVCDLKKNEIKIDGGSGSVYIRGIGETEGRYVPLSREICLALQKYFNERVDSSSYAFTSQRSERLSIRAVQHLIKGYRIRTKIENLTCHTLRNTFGHNLVQSGNKLERISLLMGHFNEDGTPNIRMIRNISFLMHKA